MNRAMVRLERGFLKELRAYRKNTAALLRGVSDGVAIRVILHDRIPVLRDLFKKWLRRAVDLFGRMLIDQVQERGCLGKLETKDAFDLYQEAVLAWLDDYALQQAVNMTGAMAEEAIDILKGAFDQGLGEDEAARILQEAIGGDFSSAARIARTEMHTAASWGTDQAARATGLDMVKEWAVTDDSRARQTHVDADGQRQEMDQPFTVGNSYLMFPGDPSGDASEVINCRCVALYHPRVNGQVFD